MGNEVKFKMGRHKIKLTGTGESRYHQKVCSDILFEHGIDDRFMVYFDYPYPRNPVITILRRNTEEVPYVLAGWALLSDDVDTLEEDLIPLAEGVLSREAA